MGRPISPRKVHRYSADFKLTAVKLSRVPGVQVQTVAEALDIHPFMLSRWRKEARDGVLRGPARRVEGASRPVRELKRLQALEREHALLQEEHELLKKAIRFCSERRRRSSRSSTANGGGSTSCGSAHSTGSRARAITRGELGGRARERNRTEN